MGLAAALISEALLYGSIQWSIASVSMSSSFSVRNFSKDQTTLNHAIEALAEYIKVGLIWTILVTALMWYNHGVKGVVISVVMNLLIMGWLWYTYNDAFCAAAHKYELIKSKLFFN